MARMPDPSWLAKDDIVVGNGDFVFLKGRRFSRPDITAIAVNNDTIEGNGILGSLRLAQVVHQFSPLSGQPAIEEQLFLVQDDAGDSWTSLKKWLKGSRINVVETTIPHGAFMGLFKR